MVSDKTWLKQPTTQFILKVLGVVEAGALCKFSHIKLGTYFFHGLSFAATSNSYQL